MGGKQEKFRSFLKNKGLKLTRERLALFDGIETQAGHFSVDALVQNLKQRGYKISRDTVYRNLSILLEFGLMIQSFKTGRDTIYESGERSGHHDHLLCRKCGMVKEFVSKYVEIQQNNIAKKYNFKLESHFHQLIGLCSKCK
jgi:Fur family ferric uptake transcriptional regulator